VSASAPGDRVELSSLYFTRFASTFGGVTLVTLLPTYIDLLDPSGIVLGLFISSLGIARIVAVVPLGWAGDRFDKRALLLGSLLASIVAYLAFSLVSTSAGFIAVRLLQGLSGVGIGLLGLALIGELAPADGRGAVIGTSNSWRMAAGILGTLGAGALYEFYGFETVFGVLAGLFALAVVGVWRFVDPDETTVEGIAFAELAVNRRILTLTSFRAQYAVAVVLVRNWIPIFVGVAAAKGGLGLSAIAVGVVVAAEKFTNMLCQPHTGRLSDRYGRALFVAVGGSAYGLIALGVPFADEAAAALGLAASIPPLGGLSPVLPLVVLANALLGVADSFREPASMALFADEGAGEGIASSFGIRFLVWRPGGILAPMIGGYLMTGVGMDWVFFVGALFAFSAVLTFAGILFRSHRSVSVAALTRW
jgi:MFS family permease